MTQYTSKVTVSGYFTLPGHAYPDLGLSIDSQSYHFTEYYCQSILDPAAVCYTSTTRYRYVLSCHRSGRMCERPTEPAESATAAYAGDTSHTRMDQTLSAL
jgi:hypothetical protein